MLPILLLPPPNLDDCLDALDPARINRIGPRPAMPSLKPLLDEFGKGLCNEESPTQNLSLQEEAPEFVFRTLDRVQGHKVNRPLPSEFLRVLRTVLPSLIHPMSTVGKNPNPRAFTDTDELLAFVVDHIVRNESRGNRRNTHFVAGSRRGYSFRLPTALKRYLELLRPSVKNPYTAQPFANLSQLIVFCLHAFANAEPWQSHQAERIWRNNRVSTRPASASTGVHSLRHPAEQKVFTSVPGMAQIHVRVDQSYFLALTKIVELLAPPLAKEYGHRLTMSGFWISSVNWAVHSIDWSADPIFIGVTDGPGIDWHELTPPGLLAT